MGILASIKKVLRKVKAIVLLINPEIKLLYTKDIFENEKYIIGDYTYGKPNVIFANDQANLKIGKFTSIAGGVTIFLGGNHRTDWISTYPFSSFPNKFPKSTNIKGHPSTKGDVVIGNDVWIGLNAVIMSGVTIGNGAVVAACSVITKNIGSYEIWVGNPAKLIGKRFDEDKILLLENMEWWNWDLNKINDNISTLSSSSLNNLSE